MISRLSFYYYVASLALLSSSSQHGGKILVQAFLPQHQPIASSLLSTLKVNLATEFLVEEFERENSNVIPTDDITQHEAKREIVNNSSNKSTLSRPERKALERAQKSKPNASSGGGGGNRKKDVNKNNDNKKKKRNNKKTSPQQQQQQASQHKFELHSQAISSLTLESTADDVLRAIKRAQNLHDEEDLRTISKFLVEEVNEHFAFGYRGSLLSRLAVAALHMNNHEIARTAIDVRRVEYRKTMLPLESAAIIRGLLRVTNVTDAWGVLDDELSLPMPVRIVLMLLG